MPDTRFSARSAIFGALLAALLPAAGPVHAQQRQTTPQTAPAAPSAPAEFRLTGFRSANFGMTADQVRQAIRKDFSLGPDKIETADNAVERTQILAVTVNDLLPNSGPAQVAYVIGFRTKQLVQVTVTWGGAVNPQLAPASAVELARMLQGYLAGVGYRPDSVATNLGQADGSIVVFRGDDAQGRRTIVVLGGVAAPEGQKPAGPPVLQISYIRDPQTPDVFQIRKGDF
jgi:hypothetical protein